VPPKPAKEFFHAFCSLVRAGHDPSKVAEGVFAAYMEVSLVRPTGIASRWTHAAFARTDRWMDGWIDAVLVQVNDGPVTMQIDSKERKPSKK
jgi:D-Tyr-tRNAtyr deacylase